MKYIVIFVFLILYSRISNAQSIDCKIIVEPGREYSIESLIDSKENAELIVLIVGKRENIKSFKNRIDNDSLFWMPNSKFYLCEAKYENSRDENPKINGRVITQVETFIWIRNCSDVRNCIPANLTTDFELLKSKPLNGVCVKLNIPKDHPCLSSYAAEVKYRLELALDLASSIKLETVDGNIPSNGDLTALMQQVEDWRKENQTSFKNLRGDVSSLKDVISKSNAILNCYEIGYHLNSDFRELQSRCFYHDNHWAHMHIYMGFSVSNYNYSKYTGFQESVNKSAIFRIYDISEIGNVSVIGADIGLKYVWSISKSPMSIHLSGGVKGNGITRCDYQWTSGTMDIRGKVDGIGDEIINVPDLGYRDGISLVGVQGQSNIKRFFPSASIDVAFHYNLEKVDFFTGVGYTISSQLKPVNPDALVSDGTHFNSLIASTNPMAIRTPYISVGASLNF